MLVLFFKKWNMLDYLLKSVENIPIFAFWKVIKALSSSASNRKAKKQQSRHRDCSNC